MTTIKKPKNEQETANAGPLGLGRDVTLCDHEDVEGHEIGCVVYPTNDTDGSLAGKFLVSICGGTRFLTATAKLAFEPHYFGSRAQALGIAQLWRNSLNGSCVKIVG